LNATLEAAMNQCATVTAIPTGRRNPITKGKCRGDDVERYFPHEPPAEYPTARAGFEAKARALCAGCPFAIQCLTGELERMADGDRATWGILGGSAPWERRRLVKNSRRASYDLEEAAIRFHERAEAVAS
jgi:hypothetical protein